MPFSPAAELSLSIYTTTAPVLPFLPAHTCTCSPYTQLLRSVTASLIHPWVTAQSLKEVHTLAIPNGFLATYSQLSKYFKEQKDGIWFMRFPLALPHSLNFFLVICEGSDPQDQMDVVFPLFSFKVKLQKTVPQYRINSKAFPFEEFVFKKHCCQLVPKMSIKEEWGGGGWNTTALLKGYILMFIESLELTTRKIKLV